MVGGNWLKSIFFLFSDHLPGFPNYTFLNFQKKFFSLHPNGQPVVLLERQALSSHNSQHLLKAFMTYCAKVSILFHCCER